MMENGVLAGYNIDSMKVRIYDGSTHTVDSKPCLLYTSLFGGGTGKNSFKSRFSHSTIPYQKQYRIFHKIELPVYSNPIPAISSSHNLTFLPPK